MAAVTNFRVESNGSDQATLRWTDNGGASNGIYRSTNGTVYTLIDTVALGVGEYTDQTVLFDTLYFYKVSNDGGTTFSTVEGVFTHPLDASGGQAVVPSYSRQDETLLHQLAQAPSFTDIPGEFDRCIICPVSGRLVLDCRLGCTLFEVDAEEDINSIAILGCSGCPTLVVNVPADTTIGICGWPVGCGMPGDECYQSPVEGGSDGRRATTSGASVVDERVALASGDCSLLGGTFGVNASCPSMAASPCFETGGIYRTTDPTPPNDFFCFRDNDSLGGCIGDIIVYACGGTAPYTWSTADLEPIGTNTCLATCGTNIPIEDENGQSGCNIQTEDGVLVTFSCVGTCMCDGSYSHQRAYGVCTDDGSLVITFNLEEGV